MKRTWGYSQYSLNYVIYILAVSISLPLFLSLSLSLYSPPISILSLVHMPTHKDTYLSLSLNLSLSLSLSCLFCYEFEDLKHIFLDCPRLILVSQFYLKCINPSYSLAPKTWIYGIPNFRIANKTKVKNANCLTVKAAVWTTRNNDTW